MSKTLKFSIIGVILLVVGYLFASPYIAIHQIKEAAQSENIEKLSSYIDYPSVRQSMKDRMIAHMHKEMAAEKNSNDGFTELRAIFASAIVDKLVNVLVKPESMALLLQGKNLKKLYPNQDQSLAKDYTANTTTNIDYSIKYHSLNHVSVNIHDKDNPKKKDSIIKMERDGLSWKVKAFELPMVDD